MEMTPAPALMELTPQESRILMPSVASLPEELLLLDQGAPGLCFAGRVGEVSEVSRLAHSQVLA